ncbi:MAG: FG-GAP repeat protein [Acidobacteriota bacterium]
MNVLKQHSTITLQAVFIALALVMISAMEVKAHKFDRGFLPPSAKARRAAPLHVGTQSGVYRTGAVRVATGDVNGDGRADIQGRRNRMRGVSQNQSASSEVWNQPVVGYRQNRRGGTQQTNLLPYIEQDNLYYRRR